MYKKQILKNGLTIIIAPLKETSTVTVLLLIKAGSRYENKEINGVSHFIEHLVFKGTKKRPSTLIISKELDAVGAEYNAFTAKDHTGYYIKINADKLELALDLLSDMIFNSKFEQEEIKREKGVIIEEINMYQDNPLIYVEDLVEQLIFQNHRLGFLVSGDKKSVRAINQKKIFSYLNKFYQPSNMVLGLAGKLESGHLKLVERYFAEIEGKKSKVEFSDFQTRQTRFQSKVLFKKTEQVQVALGWPAFGYHHPDVYAAYLLATILGGNMSSRLFIKIRDEQGLAYYIRALNNVYQDTGCFIIQAGLERVRWIEAIHLIKEEIRKIIKEGVNPEELKRAQEFLKGKLVIELENSAHLAEWYTKQCLLTKKIMTPAEKIRKILKVKIGDIQQIAKKLLINKKMSLAIIGPIKSIKELKTN